jgi:hypothetical protein
MSWQHSLLPPRRRSMVVALPAFGGSSWFGSLMSILPVMHHALAKAISTRHSSALARTNLKYYAHERQCFSKW